MIDKNYSYFDHHPRHIIEFEHICHRRFVDMGMFAFLARLWANDHEGLVTAFPVRVTPLSTSTYQLFFDQNGDMIERT